MPCDSSHLKPTEREREQRHAAKLLMYVMHQLGRSVEPWMEKGASSIYGEHSSNKDATVELCAVLDGLSPEQRVCIIYKNNTARALADWWEEHLEVDRKRRIKERQKKKKQAIVLKALDKLTEVEKKALGLSGTIDPCC